MENISILITGIGGGGVGEQILKSLRICGLKLFIIGTDITDICFSRENVDKFLIVPSAYDENYGKCIRSIVDNYNVSAIFPGSDPELRYFSEKREEFSDIYISINSKEIIKLCSDKFETYEKLAQSGFPLPQYKKINSISDCRSIDCFPVVLKPNTDSGGSLHIYVAFDKEELIMFSKYMLKHGIDTVAQEYAGDSGNEYTIGISSDRYGNIMGSVILKRMITNGLSINKKLRWNNRDIVISSGISQGEFIFDDNIKKQAECIAKTIGSKGPLNIQGRLTEGKLLIFEINPRLSGTTFLRALAGYNEPCNMIKQNILHENTDYSYMHKIVLRSIAENCLS